jgi:hypothetical protein
LVPSLGLRGEDEVFRERNPSIHRGVNEHST